MGSPAGVLCTRSCYFEYPVGQGRVGNRFFDFIHLFQAQILTDKVCLPLCVFSATKGECKLSMNSDYICVLSRRGNDANDRNSSHDV